MAKVVALYKRPVDAAAFDSYYYSKHIPIAKRIPGLRRVEASVGAVNTPAGPSPYHVVGILSFDSAAALQAALASPEGQAAVSDLAKFAHGGVDLLIFDTKEF